MSRVSTISTQSGTYFSKRSHFKLVHILLHFPWKTTTSQVSFSFTRKFLVNYIHIYRETSMQDRTWNTLSHLVISTHNFLASKKISSRYIYRGARGGRCTRILNFPNRGRKIDPIFISTRKKQKKKQEEWRFPEFHSSGYPGGHRFLPVVVARQV